MNFFRKLLRRKKKRPVDVDLVSGSHQVLSSLNGIVQYMESIREVTQSWNKLLLHEEEQLLKDFLQLELEGELPNDVSSATMIDWLVYRRRSSFRSSYQASGRHSCNQNYAELAWEMNLRIRLEKLMEDISSEYKNCRSPSSTDDQAEVNGSVKDSTTPFGSPVPTTPFGSPVPLPGSSVVVLPNGTCKHKMTARAERVLMMVDDLQMYANGFKANLVEKVQKDLVPALTEFLEPKPTSPGFRSLGSEELWDLSPYSLDLSLPGPSTSSGRTSTPLRKKLNRHEDIKVSASLSSPASAGDDDLQKTIKQIFSQAARTFQEETLTTSLSNAIFEHSQDKCQPEIPKLPKYTSSQVELLLFCPIVASSSLRVVTSPMTESVLNLLEITFGERLKNPSSPKPKRKGKTTVEDLSTKKNSDLQHVPHKASDDRRNSPASDDLSETHSRILEKLVNKTVLKMLLEEFGIPERVYKEEIISNQESLTSMSPLIHLVLWLKALIVGRTMEELSPGF